MLQLVTGRGATGAELAKSGVNKLAFTGSAATARKVLAAAAETLTPVLAECGGKDALLVDADADLDAAADAAAWGAMSNAGQTCVGVERVYVVEGVPLVPRKLGSGSPGCGQERRVGRVRADDARQAGRRRGAAPGRRGGARRAGGFGGLDSVRPPYVSPVVLVDVPEDSAAVREETFGPVVTVTRWPSLADAVRLANASPYALGSAVFTKRRNAALPAARALWSGMTSVNSVISSRRSPRCLRRDRRVRVRADHGADGLREFSGPSRSPAADEAGLAEHHFQPDGRRTWTGSSSWSRCCTAACTARLSGQLTGALGPRPCGGWWAPG